MSIEKIALIGAGALGSSWLEGQAKGTALSPSELTIFDLRPGAQALAWAEKGAQLNPPLMALSEALCVILCVKPQDYLALAETIRPHLNPKTIILSTMAGIRTKALREALGVESIARIMPTTAMATTKGVIGIFSDADQGFDMACACFQTVGRCIRLEDESLIDPVTAVCGAGPAFVYAFLHALEQAGIGVGLTPDQSRQMTRHMMIGAAALLEQGDDLPQDLIAKVASKGGSTQAGLNVLNQVPHGLNELVLDCIKAAHNRAVEMGQ